MGGGWQAVGVATTLCNPPPAQELRRRRSANKEARRHRDNSNAAPITNVFCCYTANFLFAWCCCLCRPRDAQPCGYPPSPPGSSLHTAPLPTILSEAYFSFTFSLHFLLAFFSILPPRLLSLSFPNSTERQHIKTGGGDRWPEKGLRNADIAFPRLSGPLPFDASVFFSHIVERLDAYLVVVILVHSHPLHHRAANSHVQNHKPL